jgi:hypothetical protein
MTVQNTVHIPWIYLYKLSEFWRSSWNTQYSLKKIISWHNSHNHSPLTDRDVSRFIPRRWSRSLPAEIDCALRRNKSLRFKYFELEQCVTSNARCRWDTSAPIFYVKIYDLFLSKSCWQPRRGKRKELGGEGWRMRRRGEDNRSNNVWSLSFLPSLCIQAEIFASTPPPPPPQQLQLRLC